jgi:hypothetical protein
MSYSGDILRTARKLKTPWGRLDTCDCDNAGFRHHGHCQTEQEAEWAANQLWIIKMKSVILGTAKSTQDDKCYQRQQKQRWISGWWSTTAYVKMYMCMLLGRHSCPTYHSSRGRGNERGSSCQWRLANSSSGMLQGTATVCHNTEGVRGCFILNWQIK